MRNVFVVIVVLSRSIYSTRVMILLSMNFSKNNLCTSVCTICLVSPTNTRVLLGTVW